MLENSISINGCKHYYANEIHEKNVYFVGSPLFTEVDLSINHPLGAVFKPKNVLDTPIRYVMQPNKILLFFNVNDWYNSENPRVHTERGFFDGIWNWIAALIWKKPQSIPMKNYTIRTSW